MDQAASHVADEEGVDATAVRMRAVGAMVGSGPGVAGLGVGGIEHLAVELAPGGDLILDWGPADGECCGGDFADGR